MSKNKKLAEKEEEFVKLNAELEMETKDLMEQVEQVMKLHEGGAIDSEDEATGNSLGESRERRKMKMMAHSIRADRYKKEEENGFEIANISAESHDADADVEDVSRCKSSNLETYFTRVRDDDSVGSGENGTGEDGDHKFHGSKPFLSLNREKSNKNLKTNGLAKAPMAVVSTTNIGQGLALPGKLIRHKSEMKLKDKSDTGVLPEALRGLGQEGIVRFLKAKVKMLTEQLEIIQKDEKKHIEKIKDLQNDRERVAEDRDKWIQQANIAKNVLVKHEQHASNIVVQLQNTQAENGHLKKEIEKIKKELKQINQNSGSNEVRLNRSIEEIEKLKSALRQSKQDEKDLRETHRKKTEELSGAVKRLDKQRVELLHAFKKQLIIIDNLKKQRGLIEAGKLLKSIEDDFMEFLDWNPNKV